MAATPLPRIGLDALLLLAAAVDVGEGGHVLDAGCGTGAAMLCLAARRPDLSVTGLERDALHAGLCQMSMERKWERGEFS